MMEFIPRLLEIIVFIWLVRFLVRNLFGSSAHSQATHHTSQEPKIVSGEMKKDPQCGTYVSTELSVKYRDGQEVLHFCSRECQEKFLHARSSKPA